MRKLITLILIFTLTFLPLAHAKIRISNASYATKIFTQPGSSATREYFKSFLLYTLPSLRGGTLNTAKLKFTVSSFSVNNITVEAYSSNANVSWTDATTYSTLDGYTLSGLIGSVLVTGTGNYEITITGDNTKGIDEAYDLGNKSTIVLMASGHTGTPTEQNTGTSLGGSDDEGEDEIGISDAYVEIDYSGGSSGGGIIG